MLRPIAACLHLLLSASLPVALLLGLAASPTHAQGVTVLDPDPEIEAVIASQLEAFRAEDVAGAWRFASPAIQGLFGSVENFARMVEQGYPMVWAPEDFAFVDLQQAGAMLVQRVMVIDEEGVAHYLGYAMIPTEDGWRINGVQVLPPPDIAA
jgi:hypothetical protein